jgi:tetratricopeptide (TPR) repeat protein/predicted aspartyl protease
MEVRAGKIERTRPRLPSRPKLIPLLVAAAGWFCIGVGGPARAEPPCDLTRIAELPMENHGERGPIVPVRVEGQPRRILLDTGGFASILDPSVIPAHRGHPTSTTGVLGLDGVPLTKSIRLNSVEIGPAMPKSVEFLVGPPAYAGIDGTLGADVLKNADLELDPVKGTAAFFEPARCGQAAIHWPHTDGTAVPFILDPEDQHIFMTVKLDGREINAMIDTGSPDSFITMSEATDLFKLNETSPGMQPAGVGLSKRGTPQDYYRYRFSSLEVGGLKLDRPSMIIAPSLKVDMIIGMHQLHRLHLYFAFSERTLYATSAGPAGGGPDPDARTRAQDLAEQSRAARQTGDLVSAQAAIDDAVRADPSYAPAYDERARIHLAREERQLADGDLATAIRLDPHDIDAYRALAGLDLEAGDIGKAEAAVEQAIQNNPGDPSALFLRAMLASARGRHEDALRYAATAIAMAPMRPQSFLSRSQIYAAAGDYEKAYADVDYALRLRPMQPPALNDRCWFGALLGKLDAALDDCDDAVRLRPRSAAFLDSRAFVQYRRGRFDKALADYDAALGIDPKAASSLYGRGLVKQRSGDATAAADMEAAKTIDPNIESRFAPFATGAR